MGAGGVSRGRVVGEGEWEGLRGRVGCPELPELV